MVYAQGMHLPYDGANHEPVPFGESTFQQNLGQGACIRDAFGDQIGTVERTGWAVTRGKWPWHRHALRVHPVEQRELPHCPAVVDPCADVAVVDELADNATALEMPQNHITIRIVQKVRLVASLRTASKVALVAKPVRIEYPRFHR